MKKAVFTTTFRAGALSTSRSCGSPSSSTSTVGSCAKRTFGGSFFRPCALFFSRSATLFRSITRSYEMTRFHFGTSASMIPAKVFSFSGVMFGKRTRLTWMCRISTERSSRSKETEAVKKMKPNFGAASPFFVTEMAARPLIVSPLKVSIWGWYMTAVFPLGVVNSRGQGSGVSAAARATPAARTRRRPLTSFETVALMGALLSIQYRTTRPETASPMPAPHSPPSVSRRRTLLSAERATEQLSRHGRTRVALGFPNSYEIGMSNLGFQWVYRLLNREEDMACDRFFADDDGDARARDRYAAGRLPARGVFHLVGDGLREFPPPAPRGAHSARSDGPRRRRSARPRGRGLRTHQPRAARSLGRRLRDGRRGEARSRPRGRAPARPLARRHARRSRGAEGSLRPGGPRRARRGRRGRTHHRPAVQGGRGRIPRADSHDAPHAAHRAFRQAPHRDRPGLLGNVPVLLGRLRDGSASTGNGRCGARDRAAQPPAHLPGRPHRDGRRRPPGDPADPARPPGPRIPRGALVREDRPDLGRDPLDPDRAGRARARDRAGGRQRASAARHQQEGLGRAAFRQGPPHRALGDHAAQALPAGGPPGRDGRRRRRSRAPRRGASPRDARRGAEARARRDARSVGERVGSEAAYALRERVARRSGRARGKDEAPRPGVPEDAERVVPRHARRRGDLGGVSREDGARVGSDPARGSGGHARAPPREDAPRHTDVGHPARPLLLRRWKSAQADIASAQGRGHDAASSHIRNSSSRCGWARYPRRSRSSNSNSCKYLRCRSRACRINADRFTSYRLAAKSAAFRSFLSKTTCIVSTEDSLPQYTPHCGLRSRLGRTGSSGSLPRRRT